MPNVFDQRHLIPSRVPLFQPDGTGLSRVGSYLFPQIVVLHLALFGLFPSVHQKYSLVTGLRLSYLLHLLTTMWTHEGWTIEFEGEEQAGLWDDAWIAERSDPRLRFHKGVGARVFENRDDAIASVLRKAVNWVEIVGKTIVEMDYYVNVGLESPSASEYPFKFQVGDGVRSTGAAQREGTVVTGVYYGSSTSGSYKIFYEVRLSNDKVFLSDEDDLQPALQ